MVPAVLYLITRYIKAFYIEISLYSPSQYRIHLQLPHSSPCVFLALHSESIVSHTDHRETTVETWTT